jgi:atypical dual specificity phosphatase
MRGAISEIIPHLFVGNLYAAQSEELLRQHRIEHVISIIDEDDFLEKVPRVKYIRFSIYDEPDEDIIPICEDVYKYLSRNHDNAAPVNILVHCAEGRSRSVSVVTYFLKKYDLFKTVDDALEYVKEKRMPVNIRPNVFFIDQITKNLRYTRALS